MKVFRPPRPEPTATSTRRPSGSGCAARGAGDRYEALRRPCPTCGELGLRIVYGYPGGALVAASRRNQVILGGCTYLEATHRCPNGHAWEHIDPAS